MSILLDTNACVAIMNDRPHIVRGRLDHAILRRQTIWISSVVAFELWYGAANSARTENAERLSRFLRPFSTLPFDEEDARIAGDIRAALRRAGTPIGSYDYLIAAQALRHDLLLVTANVREFSRVQGLRWEDWTA